VFTLHQSSSEEQFEATGPSHHFGFGCHGQTFLKTGLTDRTSRTTIDDNRAIVEMRLKQDEYVRIDHDLQGSRPNTTADVRLKPSLSAGELEYHPDAVSLPSYDIIQSYTHREIIPTMT
jgi:hypothetical protein